MKKAFFGLALAISVSACSDTKRIKELEAEQTALRIQIAELQGRLAAQEERKADNQRRADEQNEKASRAQLIQEQNALLDQIANRLLRVVQETGNFSYWSSFEQNQAEETRLLSLGNDQRMAASNIAITLRGKGFARSNELDAAIDAFSSSYQAMVKAMRVSLSAKPGSGVAQEAQKLVQDQAMKLQTIAKTMGSFKIKP